MFEALLTCQEALEPFLAGAAVQEALDRLFGAYRWVNHRLEGDIRA